MPLFPFVAGRKLRSSELNDAIDNAVRVKYQAADQTRNNNTTMLASTYLAFPVAANAVYTFDLCVFYSVASTADLKLEWSLPAGSSWLRSPWGSATTGTAIDSPIVHDAANNTPILLGGAGTGTAMCAIPCGIITTAGTAGDAILRFAQNTVNISDAKLLRGSWAQLSRVA